MFPLAVGAGNALRRIRQPMLPELSSISFVVIPEAMSASAVAKYLDLGRGHYAPSPGVFARLPRVVRWSVLARSFRASAAHSAMSVSKSHVLSFQNQPAYKFSFIVVAVFVNYRHGRSRIREQASGFIRVLGTEHIDGVRDRIQLAAIWPRSPCSLGA